MPNPQPKQTEDTLKEWAHRIWSDIFTEEELLELVRKIHIEAYTLGRIRKIEQEHEKHECKEDLSGDCYTCGKDMLKPQDTQEKCNVEKETGGHYFTEGGNKMCCKPQDTESWEIEFINKFCNAHQKPIRFLRRVFYDEQDGAEEIMSFIKDKIEAERKQIAEELLKIENEKWTDAKHCSCLSYAISKVFYNEEDIPRTECQSNKDAVQAERKRVKEDTIKIVEEMKKKRTYFIGGYRDQEDAGYNQVIDDIINLLKNQ